MHPIETTRNTGFDASVPASDACSAAISATGYDNRWSRRQAVRPILRRANDVPSTTTMPQNAPMPQATGPAFHVLANGTNSSRQEKVR